MKISMITVDDTIYAFSSIIGLFAGRPYSKTQYKTKDSTKCTDVFGRKLV